MPASVDSNMGISTIALMANSLSRKLSDTASVSDISLSLNRGDIVGLLGLNGAGKSTTLRMLAGVLVPDAGTVTINGISLLDEPLEARRHIGYLPDQPPLYNDMRVNEYLTLTGRIRGLKGSQLHTRLSAVTEQCKLTNVSRNLVGTLSKGFRQRVGLAQALIHEPTVVLLDEPSNGLDPQQLDSMRQLIIDTAHSAAIIVSTHLLSEAQATCNRVAIIHDGRLVADQSTHGTDLTSVFHGLTS